jgi:hypothetical protein
MFAAIVPGTEFLMTALNWCKCWPWLNVVPMAILRSEFEPDWPAPGRAFFASAGVMSRSLNIELHRLLRIPVAKNLSEFDYHLSNRDVLKV